MSDTIYSYFNGEIVPLAEAKISILTHAFNYGTACFEGIRGYWNAEDEQLYLFRLREHFERMAGSARIMGIKLPHTVDELCTIARDLVEKNGYREDIYLRPTCYISAEVIGVKMHGLDIGFCMYALPFGAYIDIEKGLKVGVSSWKRIDDNMIPARAKIAGAYVNSAFAKSEALMNGFDEAIMLTHDGHVSEGSAENIFLVTGGELVTPPPTENILQGITRDSVMEIARRELEMLTRERVVDRTELYIADEIFFTGTGAQIAPVIEVEHRSIGAGVVGPVAQQLVSL